jgi:hypothetical protein
MANEPDFSAEKRGPEVKVGDGGRGDWVTG